MIPNKNTKKIRKMFSFFLASLMVIGIILGYSLIGLGTDTALTVKEGEIILKEFTLAELETIAEDEGNMIYYYSSYNTYPSGRIFENREGPTLEGIIDAAYEYALAEGIISSAQTVDTLSDATIIHTRSADNYITKHTVKQLFNTARYFFPNITIPGADVQWYEGGGATALSDSVAVPAIVALNDSGKLCFGQACPIEQTLPYFNENLALGGTITILPDAAVKAASITALTPGTGSPVTAGANQKVDFSEPTNAQNAKIFYTISKNGTAPADPTIYNSYLYNINTYDTNEGRFPDQHPVLDTQGTTIIKVRYIEPGYIEGDITTFTYNVIEGSGNPGGDDAAIQVSSPTVNGSYTSGAKLTISGTVTGLNSVTISVKNSSNNPVFVGQAKVIDGSFSSAFNLPTVSAATSYKAYFGGAGIATPLQVGFTVNPASTPVDPDEPVDPGGSGGDSGGDSGGGGGEETIEDTVLTISGDGVRTAKSYTKEMLESYTQTVYQYSRVNTWPSKGFFVCKGIPLSKLLGEVGLKADATLITMESSDGYTQTFTRQELLNDTRYYFPGLERDSTSGKKTVPATISLRFATGDNPAYLTDNFDMRFCIGQRNITEQNLPWVVQSLKNIEVSCDDPGRWEKPSADVSPGKVAPGTEVVLDHSFIYDVKIYYTTNGKTPTIDDTMFNVSRYEDNEDLNVPIKIDRDMTIKAIAIGNGKANSEVEEFAYIVDESLPAVGGNVTELPSVDVDNPPGEPIVSELTLKGQEKNGILVGEIGNSALKALLKKEEDKWEGREDNQDIELHLAMSNASATTTGQQITIDSLAWSTLMNSAADKLVFNLGKASVVLNNKLLQELYGEGSGSSDLLVKINLNTAATLSAETEEILGGRPLLNIEICLNSKNVNSFGENIKVEIPYIKSTGEAAENIFAFYLDQEGNYQPLSASSYNADGQVVEFLTDHLSNYGVGYAASSFSDIANHWAKADIDFVASRGVVKGFGDGAFKPNDKITRAQFVKMLYSCLGGNENQVAQNGGFKDVKAGAWYYDCITWAINKGIVSGFADGTFQPDQQINREQMAVILSNYATAMNIPLYARQEAKAFSDQARISSYALKAVSKMQICGVLSGKDGGIFDPQGTAGRGEAAKLCHSMITAALN